MESDDSIQLNIVSIPAEPKRRGGMGRGRGRVLQKSAGESKGYSQQQQQQQQQRSNNFAPAKKPAAVTVPKPPPVKEVAPPPQAIKRKPELQAPEQSTPNIKKAKKDSAANGETKGPVTQGAEKAAPPPEGTKPSNASKADFKRALKQQQARVDAFMKHITIKDVPQNSTPDEDPNKQVVDIFSKEVTSFQDFRLDNHLCQAIAGIFSLFSFFLFPSHKFTTAKEKKKKHSKQF
jgi:hypothetical protein